MRRLDPSKGFSGAYEECLMFGKDCNSIFQDPKPGVLHHRKTPEPQKAARCSLTLLRRNRPRESKPPPARGKGQREHPNGRFDGVGLGPNWHSPWFGEAIFLQCLVERFKCVCVCFSFEVLLSKSTPLPMLLGPYFGRS